MAELTKKLNVKKTGAAAEEIKLYSTLDEVANKGVHIKSDGINCYAAYGNADDAKASQLNYKPSGSNTSYKVLTEAPSTSSGDGVTITLKARRNNEDFMQDLPPVKLEPGQKFYLNNANAPTIEGYDFVCCSINNFIPDKDTEINVYYIPQTVPNRIKTDWRRSLVDNLDLTGDLSLQDYANTYSATNMEALFSKSTITAPPKLNMSNVTNASNMFTSGYNDNNRIKITDIDARGWDVGNVIRASDMFRGCSSLTTLDVSSWNTNKMQKMDNMFSDCSSLTTLDVSTWDTSNAQTMSFMFSNCSSLTTLDISSWDTSKVSQMDRLFQSCSSLTILDVSSWDISKVNSIGSMFSGCSSLTTLDVSSWDTSNVYNDMSYMFANCSSLTTLDVSSWSVSGATNMSFMFDSCSSLTKIEAPYWTVDHVTDMSFMFHGCSSLTTLDITNWNTSNVSNMRYMFDSCSSLDDIQCVGGIDMSNCTDCTNMFNGCREDLGVSLQNVPRSLDLSNIGGREGTTYIIDNYLD